jgi:hypothetical protein
LKGNRSGVSRSAPFGAVDRHQAGIEIGGVECKPERAAGSLELSRQRVALEVHVKDHVIGGGQGPSAQIEAFEPLEARAGDEHVGIDRDDALEAGRQNLVEKEAAKDGARKAPARPQIFIEAGEVDFEELDALAQGSREPVEAPRHVARLADEDDLVAPVRLGFDQRSDGAQSRGKERAVRREAIGGSHQLPSSWPRFDPGR